jgi:hypothetical protein
MASARKAHANARHLLGATPRILDVKSRKPGPEGISTRVEVSGTGARLNLGRITPRS